MATIGNTVLTLADWAKRRDPNGKTADIVELLSQTNEVLTDMLWKEGNLATGEQVTQRTGLPAVYYRLINQGVAKSKSTTAQIVESCSILEARSEVDVDLANLEADVSGFRLSEATAFTEGMNQQMATSLFYGNSTLNPEQFMGLAPRYSSLSAANGQNIVAGGGSGSDNSSVWLIVWGAQTCYGVFPKGSMAGLLHEDLGIGDAFDGSNNRFRAYMDRWQWKPGVALKDWRYAVRIANIDISALVAESSAANLIKLMIKAVHRIPTMGMGRPVFYMNRSCAQMLDIQRFNVMSGTTGSTIAGGSISYDQVDGRWVPTFRGIPIRIVDALTEAEATVS